MPVYWNGPGNTTGDSGNAASPGVAATNAGVLNFANGQTGGSGNTRSARRGDDGNAGVLNRRGVTTGDSGNSGASPLNSANAGIANFSWRFDRSERQ